MAYDPRSNPDPSSMRDRLWYALDGRDLLGVPQRALFEVTHQAAQRHGGGTHGADMAAVEICRINVLVGDLYAVPAAEEPHWRRWQSSFVPGSLQFPLPETGRFVGTLSFAGT